MNCGSDRVGRLDSIKQEMYRNWHGREILSISSLPCFCWLWLKFFPLGVTSSPHSKLLLPGGGCCHCDTRNSFESNNKNTKLFAAFAETLPLMFWGGFFYF